MQSPASKIGANVLRLFYGPRVYIVPEDRRPCINHLRTDQTQTIKDWNTAKSFKREWELLRINLEQAKTPWWVRLGIPLAVWSMPPEKRTLYLTFDDGPTPGVTERVLDLLNAYGAQATFFCLGQQAVRYPHLIQRILAAGHSVGNHGNRHLNGWQTPSALYMSDVSEAAQILHAQCGFRSRLFRPPFGRLRWDAMLHLSRDYKIMMWDSLSMDYRPDIPTEQVTRNVVSSAGAGSIVLWHDSELAAAHLWESLPRVLQHFSAEGFSFARVDDGRPCQFVLPPN